MIKIIYSKAFLKEAKLLTVKSQTKLASLINLLSFNPFDSSLHTKKLSGKLYGLFSFRITRDWRVIFQFTEIQTIHLISVKHRKDIYK